LRAFFEAPHKKEGESRDEIVRSTTGAILLAQGLADLSLIRRALVKKE